MSRMITGLATGLAAAAFALLTPSALQAQVPVVLICQDGTTQPGSSKVACGDHGGMDWEATKAWSEMRAGRFAVGDTVVCTDGQAAPAAPTACAQHGGVDSVSTVAAVKRRAAARKYADAPTKAARAEATSDSAKADSTKWGHQTSEDADQQNPPGYRGYERPVNVVPSDSAALPDTAASAQATDRAHQMKRQDTLSAENQNPPGYRGMERPAGLDSAMTESGDTAAAQRSKGEAAATKASEGEASASEGEASPEEQKEAVAPAAADSASAQPATDTIAAADAAARDSVDVIHREAEVAPGVGHEPPPYPADSQQVWVEKKPGGDSVTVSEGSSDGQ